MVTDHLAGPPGNPLDAEPRRDLWTDLWEVIRIAGKEPMLHIHKRHRIPFQNEWFWSILRSWRPRRRYLMPLEWGLRMGYPMCPGCFEEEFPELVFPREAWVGIASWV